MFALLTNSIYSLGAQHTQNLKTGNAVRGSDSIVTNTFDNDGIKLQNSQMNRKLGHTKIL